MSTARPFLLALALCPSLAPPAPAADLPRIERVIIREPSYHARPRYCLLVFGREAKTRVWLVLDGDVLYVDRNANGDLTEPGERVAMPRFGRPSTPYVLEERQADLGDIPDGDLKHTGLQLTQQRVRADFVPKDRQEEQLKALVRQGPEAFIYSLGVWLEVRPQPDDKVPIRGRVRQTAGADAQGYLHFAERAADAPIIHFGGPLEMGLFARQVLTPGDKPSDLMTMIGTPGLGAGTFASLEYAGLISDNVHPAATIEFPPGVPGAGPIRTRVLLPYRC